VRGSVVVTVVHAYAVVCPHCFRARTRRKELHKPLGAHSWVYIVLRTNCTDTLLHNRRAWHQPALLRYSVWCKGV
jgi:hypothetical protein